MLYNNNTISKHAATNKRHYRQLKNMGMYLEHYHLCLGTLSIQTKVGSYPQARNEIWYILHSSDLYYDGYRILCRFIMGGGHPNIEGMKAKKLTWLEHTCMLIR